jgi:hypothetical protein
MSAAAEMEKHPFLRALARVEKLAPALALLAPDDSGRGPIESLVRQVFFPSNAARRTRVLFATAGPETNPFAFAQRVGGVLSEFSDATVALVEGKTNSAVSANPDGWLPTDSECRRSNALQVTERMWRVPAHLFPDSSTSDRGSGWAGTASNNLPFDYVLFAASISDRALPLFCSHCQGAVLVLTANQTRKESALQAKRVLQQCNADLLGTVLDGRQFPIPEAIYRRL